MSSKEPQPNDAEKNIEIWKVKKLIKRLEAARGNGTSMISLIIRMYPHYEGKSAPLIQYSAQGPSVTCSENVG